MVKQRLGGALVGQQVNPDETAYNVIHVWVALSSPKQVLARLEFHPLES